MYTRALLYGIGEVDGVRRGCRGSRSRGGEEVMKGTTGIAERSSSRGRGAGEGGREGKA